MSDPSLRVELENGIAEVGGSFRGRLIRAPILDDLAESSPAQGVRGVRVNLTWHTEGRGDRDRAELAEVAFPIDANGRADAHFELPVPPFGPISYDGNLIRVIWHLEARVDVKLRLDKTTRIPVLVIPRGGWGQYHRPHPLRGR